MSLHDRQKLNISPRAAAVQEKYTLAALNKEYSRNIQQGSFNRKKAVIDNLPEGDNVSDVSSCDSSSIDSSVAEILSKKRDSVLGILNRQVIYSFVAYTVGNHQDVTKTNVPKELIECKAFLRWLSKSMPESSCQSALGRGGMGPGIFTVMIVDHPKK
jgi:hypothetical protein